MRRGALENKHPIVMNVCIGLASGFAGFRIQPHRYKNFLICATDNCGESVTFEVEYKGIDAFEIGLYIGIVVFALGILAVYCIRDKLISLLQSIRKNAAGNRHP
jgi:hypothetical protein